MTDSGLGVFFLLPVCCGHKGASFLDMLFLIRYCIPEKGFDTGFCHIVRLPCMLAFAVGGCDGLSVQCCNPGV